MLNCHPELKDKYKADYVNHSSKNKQRKVNGREGRRWLNFVTRTIWAELIKIVHNNYFSFSLLRMTFHFFVSRAFSRFFDAIVSSCEDIIDGTFEELQWVSLFLNYCKRTLQLTSFFQHPVTFLSKICKFWIL